MSAGRGAELTALASSLVVAFGALIVVNAGIASVRGAATGADVSFAALLMAVAIALAMSLRRHTRWAWWGTLMLASLGLFFVLPIAGTVLLGGSLEPVGTGWDVVFFPATAALLVVLLIVLWMLRKAFGTPRSPSEDS